MTPRQKLKQWFEYLPQAVSFLIPATAALFGSVVTGLQALLNLGGIRLFFSQSTVPSLKEASPFRATFIVFIFYFCVEALSPLLFEDTVAGLKRLGTAQNFLLFVPGLIWLIHTPSQNLLHLFVKGARIGACAAGLLTIIEIAINSIRSRPDGIFSVNPILFSDFALILSCMSLLYFDHETKRQRYFAIVAAFLGLLAMLFSQSRGVWLATPLLAMIMLRYLLKMSLLSWKQITLATIPIVIAGTLAFTNTHFQRRVTTAIGSLQEFDMTKKPNTSTKQRLHIYVLGWRAFQERPLLGYGTQNRMKPVYQAAESKVKRDYSHLHNEYLTNMVGKGLLGLISLLAVLGLPLYLVLIGYKRYATREMKYFALILVGCYAQFGLTNLIFGHDLMNSFYTFSVCLLAASLHHQMAKQT